jgi:hypothetical protein
MVGDDLCVADHREVDVRLCISLIDGSRDDSRNEI